MELICIKCRVTLSLIMIEQSITMGAKKCLILVADFTTGQVMQGGQVSNRGVILIDSGKSTPSEVIFSFTVF